MSQTRNIKVMISSRCKDHFPMEEGTSLGDVRHRLKDFLQGDIVLGRRGFDAWISEDEPSGGGDVTSIERCLRIASTYDLVIVLWNGHAGSILTGRGLGICHAEALTAFNQRPRKVVVVRLGSAPNPIYDRPEDIAFNQWIEEKGFYSQKAESYEQLESIVGELAHKALLDNCILGLTDPANGNLGSSNNPKWNNLGDRSRNQAMIRSLQSYFSSRPGFAKHRVGFETQIRSRQVLLIPHALPGRFNSARTGEFLRQMFHDDHNVSRQVDDSVVGPVHIVACHRSITETQAAGLMPIDDPIPNDHPKYGILMTDHLHGYQAIFIRSCVDPDTTTMQLQHFLNWLETSVDHQFIEHAAEHRLVVDHLGSVKRKGIRRTSRTGQARTGAEALAMSNLETIAVNPQMTLPGIHGRISSLS